MRAILLALLWLAVSCAPAAAACEPPRGWVDVPHPQVAPAGELVSHSEDIVIARPLASVLKTVVAMDLHHTIKPTSALPGVEGTYLLTQEFGRFGAPGSRQFECLSDGSTLEEQSLLRADTPNDSRFRYVVWNYTTEAARPIRYGVGEFHYVAIEPAHTRIHWTYSFALDGTRFPGYLGSLGQFLFRVWFLDRDYAQLMKGVLATTKQAAESAPKELCCPKDCA
jgi:hypothetical protein